MFERGFDSVTVTEIKKIINKEAKVKRWLAINDGSREDARGIRARKEAKGSEGLSAGVVPVSRTTFEAVECLFEEEVSVRRSNGADFGWADDVLFVIR